MSNSVQKQQKAVLITLLAIISIGAGWYIATCTQYAPWGFSDSTAYFSAARNFAAGKGLGTFSPDGVFSPLLIFAPLYSILLSIFALFNVDLIIAVRFLDITFFAILIASSGWLFYLITKSFWGSLCMALMITTTPVMGSLFTSLMSEPLALVLGIPGFFLLIYAIRQNSTRWLVVAAILSALALLTRYAFAAFPAAGVICLLLLSNKTLSKKINDALKYGAISFGPILIWIAAQIMSKNSVGARTYSTDFVFSTKISQFVSQLIAVLKYLLPYRTNMIPGLPADIFRPVLLLLFIAIIIFGFYFGIKKYFAPEHQITGLLSLGFAILIVSYLLVLFVTYLVSTETISIDDRMLSPIIPIFYALILSCALSVGQRVHPKVTFPVIPLVIAAFFMLYNFQPFKAYPVVVGNFPNGYTSPIWNENPILTGEIRLPTDRPLISNAPDILLFYTNRSAYTLSVNSESRLSINYETSLDDLIHQKCAVLILFDPATTQRFEQLSDSITNAEISVLKSQLDSLYSSKHGLILADNNCNK